MNRMKRWDVVVIGGGLAGLTAAVVTARKGKATLLLERSDVLGGRSRTNSWGGFSLNSGPRAFYKGGSGWTVLKDLGVMPSGSEPRFKGRGLRGGALHVLPSGPFSLISSTLLDWKEKAAFISLMSQLPKVNLNEASKLSCTAWIEQNVPNRKLREVIAALLRVSAYSAELDHLSAGTAIRRLLESQKGVYYVDGGWSSLVTDLAHAAKEAGAMFRLGASVVEVLPEDDGFVVTMKAGGAIHAEQVILATSPEETRAMLPPDASLRLDAYLDGARPVKATCLDLCLSKLPNPNVNLGIGIDEPIFMTAQSETAKVAPDGAALVHLVYYHEKNKEINSANMRTRMEAFMEMLQPGWRSVLEHERLLSGITVTTQLDEPGRRRISSEDLGLSGLHLAGDWIGSEGWLADASLVSGRMAGLDALLYAACA